MKMNFWKRGALIVALGLGTTGTLPLLAPTSARADRAFRDDLVGEWITDSGESYTLRSNGTYTFKTGIKGSGNVSHSGTWSLRESGHTLRLHSTSRVVLERRKRRTLKANKTFRLAVENLDPETITLDKEEFHRPREGRARED